MKRTIGCVLAALAMFATLPVAAVAQTVDPTPSRATLVEAARESCDGVSVVVQRCAARPAKSSDDALVKSRAATKAAFERRDNAARAAALQGVNQPLGSPAERPERLAPVTVTGRGADHPDSIEQVLQRALAPPVVPPDGTVSHYGPDGLRYDCIAKCVGPACCATVRSLPNPARDSNSIGR